MKSLMVAAVGLMLFGSVLYAEKLNWKGATASVILHFPDGGTCVYLDVPVSSGTIKVPLPAELHYRVEPDYTKKKFDR